MRFKNILVTGCGGDIGLSIGKILKKERTRNNIFGMDIHMNHPGRYIFDTCLTTVKVTEKNYLTNLKKILIKHAITLIIPTSEQEIRFFHRQNILDNILGIPLIIANKKSLEIGLDKFKTYQFLKKNNLPYPWTYIINRNIPKEFPCILKNRFGSGSVGLQLIDKELFYYYRKKKPSYIIQEYLLPEKQEYTCCVYRSNNNEVRTIIIQRRLKEGFTVYGKIIHNKNIESLLIKIAQLLQLKGSINIQLRLTKRGPIIFEINPRFSSTVLFRHLLGFKDLMWSIWERQNKKLDNYNRAKQGTEFFRGTYEYINLPNFHKQLK